MIGPLRGKDIHTDPFAVSVGLASLPPQVQRPQANTEPSVPEFEQDAPSKPTDSRDWTNEHQRCFCRGRIQWRREAG